MSHPSQRGARRKDAATRRSLHRLSVLFTSLLLVLGFSPALAQAADAKVTQSDLCNAWNTSTTSPEVTLASGYKITGDKLVRSGASCAAADASVAIIDSSIAEVGTSSGGNAASRMLAAAVQTAASEGDIEVGDEVFAGATINSLTAVLQNGFIGIKGGLEINWSSGTATKFNFEGRFYALDRFSLVLRSPAEGTVLPGVGGEPINFVGDLVKDSAGYHMNVNGSAPLVTVGTGDKQITVSNATLKMTLANVLTGDGLKVSVTGDGGLGSAVKLTGAKLDAEFDSTGLLKATGNGTVAATIPANGQLPVGKATGTADITFIRDGKQQVDFAGEVRFADALVANAKGVLDMQALTFTGDATLTSNDLLVKGAVEGIAYWGDNLAGRTIENRSGATVAAEKGDVLVSTATASIQAKGVDVKGSARIGDVDGEQWAKGTGSVDLTLAVAGLPDTAIKGTADFGWVRGSNPTVDFKGTVGSGSTAIASATGTIDGDKIDLTGTGSLVNPDLSIKGTVDGVVYYGDKSTDQITNKAGAKVTAKKGDFVLRSATAKVSAKGFELTGAASMARVGGDLWASGGGTVDLTVGETSLKGSADMTWVSGELPAVAFSGNVKHGTTAVGSASGTVDGQKLTIKGEGAFSQSGLTIKGAVDGVVYYGSDLSGLTIIDGSGKETAASKGDWIVKSATADATYQTLKLGATASFGSVAGKEWAKASGTLSGSYNDTELAGSANVTWVEGTSPSATYNGTVTAFGTTLKASGTIDANKITTKGDLSFSTAQIMAQGVFEGVLYYGDVTGVTLPNSAGKQVAARPGDFVLKATANGQALVWNTLITGDATIVKAGAEMYASGGGTVSVSGGGVKITGTGAFTWQEEQYPVLTFAGSVSNGTTTAIANATGTLNGRVITLKGDAKITDPGWTFTGAAEGYMYYGAPGNRKVQTKDGQLVKATKGDFFLKTAAGKLETQGTTVSGQMSAGKFDGALWVNAGGTIDSTFGNPAVNIKGSATLDWSTGGDPALTFNGTVTTGTTVLKGSGVMDGKKIAFTGDASSTVGAFALKGSAEGVVYYADPAGATLPDATGKQVAAQKGDFVVTSATGSVTAQNLALSGKATLGKVGSVLYASGSGDVDATYNGATLKGSATASWIDGQAPAVNFEGTVTYGNVVVAGKGTVDGKKVTINGTAKATDPNYALTGAATAIYYYADPAGDLITDASGAKVAAAKGDAAITSGTATITAKGVTVTGNATGGKNGNRYWIKGDGNLDATYGGAAIKGTATFSWATGTTGVLDFTGTVSAGNTVLSGKGELDAGKIALTATAKATDSSFTLEGSLSGYVYYGDPAGAKITNASGNQVAASKGDWSLTGANAKLTTKGTTVTGTVTAAKVGTDVWVKAGGTLDVTFGDPAVTIKGSANVSYDSSSNPGALTFEGTVTGAGVTLTGKGTMDGKKIAFQGDANYAGNGLTVKGAAEGVVYYADPAGATVPDASGKQVAAQKGDFVVTAATGSVTAQNLALSGKATLGKVGSQVYASGTGNVDATSSGATLKGSATASWQLGQDVAVNFDGTITYGNTVVTGKGTVDGKKVTVKGTAKGTEGGIAFTGAAEAVYYYADPAGDQITGPNGTKVAAAKGDAAITSATLTATVQGVTVNGNATGGKNGDKLWIKGSGTLDATYGGVALKGNATFGWATGTTAVVNFDGTVSAGNTVFSGKGELDGGKITLKATAKATDSSFTLDGSLEGYVYIGDPAGAKITNGSGTEVAASKGDWMLTSASATLTTKGTTVTGKVTAGKVGSEIWIRAGGTIDVTFGNPAVNIKGSAGVSYSSTANPGAIVFEGTVTGAGVTLTGKGTMDGKKIAFQGDANYAGNGFSVKGDATGVVYYADPAGDTLADASGKQVAAQKGDFVVTTATGSVTAQNLAIAGKATLGKVGSEIYANGTGTVDASYGGAVLKGSAAFNWIYGSAPSATFEGTVTAGNIVATAKGAVDGKTIAVKGDVKVTDPNFTLTGSAEGLYYYADPAGAQITGPNGTKVAAAKGDFVVSSASGQLTAKGTTVKGNVSAGKGGSKLWAKGGGSIDGTYGAIVLKGSANFAWETGTSGSLTFEGTVTSGNTVLTGAGEMDGSKIALKATAKSSDASWSVNGSLEGVVYYGDPAGAQIPNSSGTKVAAAKGDWYLSSATATLVAKGATVAGGVTAGKVGSDTWIKGGGSIDITVGNPAVNIKGSATASWTASGGIGSVTFEGTVTSGDAVLTGKGAMDGKKIVFQGNASYVRSGLSVKGAAEGYVYYADPAGETITNAAGNQVAASKGDFLITSATGSVVVSNLTVAAKAKIGKVGDTAYVNGTGTVDLAFGSTVLKGSAAFAWTGTLSGGATNPTVNIDGVVTSGNAVINVKGAVDGKKIVLKGDAKLTESSYTLTGAMEGVFYYANPGGDTIPDASGKQVAAQQGDFSLASATGQIVAKGITVKGNVSAGKNGSALWAKGGGSVDASFGSPVTTLKGSAAFVWTSGGVGTMSFEGTVTQGTYKLTANGTLNGKKLTFTGALTSPDLSGNGAGVVYYGDDLSGETITNRSGQTVAASKGDFRVDITDGKATLKQITATADFTLSKVGAVIWAKANAEIKVGESWLTFTGEIEANGGNVNMKASGNAVIDGYKVNFNGTATIVNNALTINGTVDVVTGLFGVRLTGTLNKPNMNTSTYSFVGKGAFRFGGFQIADATIRFITGEGITTQFSVKTCLLFLCTNGTFKLYFSGTEISKIQLSAPITSWPAFFAIAKITAPSIPVETKITGIF